MLANWKCKSEGNTTGYIISYYTSVFSVPGPDRWPLLQNNYSSHPVLILVLFFYFFFAADIGLCNGKADQMKSRRALNLY